MKLRMSQLFNLYSNGYLFFYNRISDLLFIDLFSILYFSLFIFIKQVFFFSLSISTFLFLHRFQIHPITNRKSEHPSNFQYPHPPSLFAELHSLHERKVLSQTKQSYSVCEEKQSIDLIVVNLLTSQISNKHLFDLKK